jgi:uncharacterized repeat protein (TIGR01451 family)
VDKTVDNKTPTGLDQTVEFTVTVTNTGSEIQEYVRVEDKLPPELTFPVVMIPSTDKGRCDAKTGMWLLGDMEPGASASLSLPTIYSGAQQPACAVNVARLVDGESEWLTPVGLAALRGPGTASCVDLDMGSFRSANTVDPCKNKGTVRHVIRIRNMGPGNANNVLISLKQTSPFKLPGLHFKTPGCSRSKCQLGQLPAKAYVDVIAESEVFKNETSKKHSMELQVSSNGEEYDPVDNKDTFSFTIGRFTGTGVGPIC